MRILQLLLVLAASMSLSLTFWNLKEQVIRICINKEDPSTPFSLMFFQLKQCKSAALVIMTLTSALSLPTTGTACMKLTEHKETDHFCDLKNHVVAAICHQNQVSLEESDHQHGSFGGRKLQPNITGLSLPLDDIIHFASLHHLLPSNEWLAFWLFLVACSYFLLSINAYFLGNWKVKSAERANSNARTDQNDDKTNHSLDGSR
ncbi:hypothetical protein PIB30_005236 [Stylosanthes scabra]|uniref:Uncharacterized protein n=1 Tax=Stylosanthes scabra TaxID=79078 RepID=A0ABU6T3M5_9FABA|nr:hypothetical protein [Stylosanthes scabra]